jgi:hypothetical protein
MKIYYKFWNWISQLTGKNSKYTPTAVIKDQLNEKRARPLGVAEFHIWSDRIISGACIPGATAESIKFALADQLLHLGPTVDFESDLYFIKCLRKFAINQVADSMRREIRDTAKARLDAEKTKLEIVENKPGEVTPPTNGVTYAKEVLGNN